LLSASAIVAGALRKGGVVVYESTVYPGVTEDLCAPLLARLSGLARSDFRVAYSPERINPGDVDHTLERTLKVVAAEDEDALERVAAAYGAIVEAGIHRAPSIKVAEAAKVIENTQRDLNIALMNELAFIFERMGLRTADVLAVAETKWNFLKFRPGLVGGHCVGVDPYYLTVKAQELGYEPEVILAGRRINNDVAPFIARKTVKMLIAADIPLKGARVGVLGLTFKEDCHDLRNSKVPDLLAELRTYGIEALIHDPLGDPREAQAQYRLKLSPLDTYRELDALILAVNHGAYAALGPQTLVGFVRDGGVFVDVKSALSAAQMERGIQYFSL
jgi:UDP-N-acetyl-D-galactosamine dehydrogenase